MLVIVCPGQGSQSPGFLAPWMELPAFAERMSSLSEAAGIDLVAHGTTSDAETIRDTAVAQPLLVASGLAALSVLVPEGLGSTTPVGAVGGHSVGEITAAAAAGVLAEDEAVVFVRERGRAMAEASSVTPTGMSAVLGGDPDEVAAVLDKHGLTPANVNGAGQVVAAGTLEQLAALKDEPPAKARVIPLQVAGAFHTQHMAPAVGTLAERAASMTPKAPNVALVSNADGTVVVDGAEVLARLVSQVSNPVRWDLCQATLTELGATALIELPPAGTLANLAKRTMPGIQTLALKTPDQLDIARALIAQHAGESIAPEDNPRTTGADE